MNTVLEKLSSSARELSYYHSGEGISNLTVVAFNIPIWGFLFRYVVIIYLNHSQLPSGSGGGQDLSLVQHLGRQNLV